MWFRYPMQKLVDLKMNEKEHAEWQLADAIGRLQQEQLSLSELLSEEARVRKQVEASSAERTTISRLQSLQHYLVHLEQQIRLKQNDVGTAQDNVSTKRNRLTEKVKEEKIWTKAKEKAQDQFKVLMLRKEQEELDEMALV